MAADAVAIASWVTAGGSILAVVFGYGRLNQKVVDMAKRVEQLESSDKAQNERLGNGAVAFAHIEEGLKSLIEGQGRIEGAVNIMSDRLDNHIDKGERQ